MHSNVTQYIACSGEFFIRRVKSSGERGKPLDEQTTHPPNDIDGGPPGGDPPKDISKYELIIDNE